MNQQQLLAECLALQQSFSSLLLATADISGEPLTSFAPYVEVDGSFYVLLSDLAQHTCNMQENPRASVMFIEAEESAKNIYARRRAVIQVSVHQLGRTSERSVNVLELMLSRHGGTVAVLKGLSDFNVYELRPITGRYVIGFAKAYDWDVQENTLTLVSAESLKGAS
ncbi:MAG: pyridoxamine 5'-phosphate oxidase family protein [Oceanospirillaceae bacterium]|nr:pyridoxamine 5'-phosphate oxidase family protein [Oceanospirillaceae bacterium]